MLDFSCVSLNSEISNALTRLFTPKTNSYRFLWSRERKRLRKQLWYWYFSADFSRDGHCTIGKCSMKVAGMLSRNESTQKRYDKKLRICHKNLADITHNLKVFVFISFVFTSLSIFSESDCFVKQTSGDKCFYLYWIYSRNVNRLPL